MAASLPTDLLPSTTAPAPDQPGEPEARSRQPWGLRLRGPRSVQAGLGVGCLGLVIQVTGYALGWLGIEGPALPLWEIGLAVLAAAAGWLQLTPAWTDRQRLVAALGFAHLMYLSWMTSNAVLAARFDETLHVSSLLDLTSSHTFFLPNEMLPVSPFFPGLELATVAVHWMTGLPLFGCQVIVVMLARTVLIVALFAIVQRITKSSHAAGVAIVLYGASPQFYFFNSQFSYQTIAIAMLAAAMLLLVRAFDQPQRWPWAEIVMMQACLTALAISHHVTSWLTLGGLLVLALLFTMGREWRRARLTATAAGINTVLIVIWTAIVGERLVNYLQPVFKSAAVDVISMVAGDGAARTVGASNAGTPTPPHELAIMMLSVLTWLALLTPSCWRAWRRGAIGRTRARYLPLVLAAAYPSLLLSRFSSEAAEIGDRISTFLFLGMMLVVSPWVVPRLRRWGALAIPVAVILICGGAILGSGPTWARVTGGFLAGAEQRSFDSQTLAVAQWVSRYVPRGSRIAADNTFNRVLPNFAEVTMVTRPGGLASVVPVFIAKDLDGWEREILVDTKTDFLIADTRLAGVRASSGSLFEGSGGYGDAGSLFSAEQFAKFATTPGFELVADGPVKIYDVRGLRQAPRTFSDNRPAGLPGSSSPVQSAWTLAVLLTVLLLLLRFEVRWNTRRTLWLVLPCLMLLGGAAVILKTPPLVGSLELAGLAAGVIDWRRRRRRRPTSRPSGRIGWVAIGLCVTLCLVVSAACAAIVLRDAPDVPPPVTTTRVGSA